MYVSYFAMNQGGVDLIDQALNNFERESRFFSYAAWFINQLEELRGNQLEWFHERLNEVDKSQLTFDQVLMFRVAQGE